MYYKTFSITSRIWSIHFKCFIWFLKQYWNFFLACEVEFKMPLHLQLPSSTASSGASTKTIPSPFLEILSSRDLYLHYFGKGPEGRPVKDHRLLSHIWVYHIWTQLHAIGSFSHVSFRRIVSRSTVFLRRYTQYNITTCITKHFQLPVEYGQSISNVSYDS